MTSETTRSSQTFDLRVGKVTGAHGLKGVLKVHCDFNNPELLMDADKMGFAKNGKLESESEIEDMRLEKNVLYVTLKDHPSRNHIEKYFGQDAMMCRAELPDLDEDEWWVSDLIGIEVYTTKGILVGTVSDVVGTRGELLEVTKFDGADSEPLLIPFVKQLVPVVDLVGRRIEVDAIPGLLE